MCKGLRAAQVRFPERQMRRAFVRSFGLEHHVAAILYAGKQRSLGAFCDTVIKAIKGMREQASHFAPSLGSPLHRDFGVLFIWQGVGQHRFQHQIKGLYECGIAFRLGISNCALMGGEGRYATRAGGKGLCLLVWPNRQRRCGGAHCQQGGATEKTAEGRAC